jgi:hypothetical protein
MPSIRMWRRVGLVKSDVSEEHVSILKVEEYTHEQKCSSWLTEDGRIDGTRVCPQGSVAACPHTAVAYHHSGNSLTAHQTKKKKNKQTPWPLVRKRTIPTERPPLVDEI